MADSKKFRDAAERLRKEAAEVSHVETRRTMLKIARLYDQVADTLTRQRREPKSG
jgi:hypothetical protein